MKFESNGRNGHMKDWSDLNHNGEHKKVQHGRVAYITVQVGHWEPPTGDIVVPLFTGERHQVVGHCQRPQPSRGWSLLFTFMTLTSHSRRGNSRRRCQISPRLTMTRRKLWSSASPPGRCSMAWRGWGTGWSPPAV